MESDRHIPWPRILAEGAAIVVSILLAFSIQAWWDDRQERDEERELLVTLLEEFEDKKRRSQDTQRYAQAIKDSVEELLEIALNSELEASEQHTDRLIGFTYWFNEGEAWRTGALNSLIVSGNLNLISNQEVRTNLGNWWIWFGRMAKYADVDRDFYHNRQVPFLSKYAFLPQILNAIEHEPGNPGVAYEYGEDYRIESRINHSELLANREYQNILVERSMLLTDLLTIAYRDVEAEIDKTIVLLRQSLDEYQSR